MEKARSSKMIIFEAVTTLNRTSGISLSIVGDELEHFFVLKSDGFTDFIKELFSLECEKVCFDMRDVLRLGSNYKQYCDVIDMSVVCSAGNDNLYRVANRELKESDIVGFINKRQRVMSHIKACQTAKVNFNNCSIVDVVPSDLLISFYRIKNEMLLMLRNKFDVSWFKDFGYNRSRALYEIEQAGIKIDTSIELAGDKEQASSINWLNHAKSKSNNESFAYAKFIPQKSKTGRIQVAKNSLKCMNIPKTPVRKSIVSRFEDGEIASFDFNAADYRCIVAATEDEQLNSLYSDCDDFHDRTVEIIFGNRDYLNIRRTVIKHVTYVSIYGGSHKSISKGTGLSEEKIEAIINKLDFMNPIFKFRKELHEKSIKNGFVNTLTGMKIPTTENDHEGKVLALFAQTCTNDAFMDGVINVHDFLSNRKSKILFTVHDELVIDMHPSELSLSAELVDMMELGSARIFGERLKVKMSSGKNYWDIK